MWKVAVPVAVTLAGVSSAAAMPPPVPVQPLLIVASKDLSTKAALTTAVRRLAERGYLSAYLNKLQSVGVGSKCIRSLKCVDPAAHLKHHGAEVAVIAFDPEWRSADHQVRCVGPDPLRSYLVRISLRDAGSDRPTIAHPELVKLAGCIIGSIHAPPRAD
ncbi:hypothetical protein G7078_09580 [Sphingomonas sinipercae]|uniref:Uncharacterized protein n=1 Tax=Sphingomonas sinipercae TaxID=2714944 RepID=A0A6G7ZPZ0_9SPHN|nr:hypothetical protein [Sphingomonas sinipercae]QIL02998.1 hypothetical protein G7078_09580 [Sphingomonas sinipercae]